MKLGYVDVDKMLDSISWTKFQEWRAYSILEPFDETRQDIRTASIVSRIANLFQKNPIPMKEFVLPFGEQAKPKKTWQQMKQTVFMYVGAGEKKGKKNA